MPNAFELFPLVHVGERFACELNSTVVRFTAVLFRTQLRQVSIEILLTMVKKKLFFFFFKLCFSLKLGGIGKLTDGVLGGNEDCWLVWNKSPVTIRFQFDTSRHFKMIRIYFLNNKYKSVRIHFDKNQLIDHDISPQSTSLSTIFVDTIYLNEHQSMIVGKQVELQLEFDSEFLFLTEIVFDTQPAVILNTTTKDCQTGRRKTSKTENIIDSFVCVIKVV